jgi:uncharacterized transporter YbjL
MNSNEAVETIELSIKQAQVYVNKMDSVYSLIKNKDFINVIEEGYFKEEASRLVLLKADPTMQKPDDQVMLNKSIDAIGYFRQYLSNTIQMGRMMEKSILSDQEMRQEILAEGEE